MHLWGGPDMLLPYLLKAPPYLIEAAKYLKCFSFLIAKISDPGLGLGLCWLAFLAAGPLGALGQAWEMEATLCCREP